MKGVSNTNEQSTKDDNLHGWNADRKGHTSDQRQCDHPAQLISGEIFGLLDDPHANVQRPQVIARQALQSQLSSIREVLNQHDIVARSVGIKDGSQCKHREEHRCEETVAPLVLASEVVVDWKRDEEQHASPIHHCAPIGVGTVHGKAANTDVHRSGRKQNWVHASPEHWVFCSLI